MGNQNYVNRWRNRCTVLKNESSSKISIIYLSRRTGTFLALTRRTQNKETSKTMFYKLPAVRFSPKNWKTFFKKTLKIPKLFKTYIKTLKKNPFFTFYLSFLGILNSLKMSEKFRIDYPFLLQSSFFKFV